MPEIISAVKGEELIDFIAPVAPWKPTVDDDSRPLLPSAMSVDKACNNHLPNQRESSLPIRSSLSEAPDRSPFYRSWLGLVSTGSTCLQIQFWVVSFLFRGSGIS